jgi:hypothetical protein
VKVFISSHVFNTVEVAVYGGLLTHYLIPLVLTNRTVSIGTPLVDIRFGSLVQITGCGFKVKSGLMRGRRLRIGDEIGTLKF